MTPRRALLALALVLPAAGLARAQEAAAVVSSSPPPSADLRSWLEERGLGPRRAGPPEHVLGS